MALVILGATKCSICEKIIYDGDKYQKFAPFIANKDDPLRIFSDAACHDDCFYDHPLAKEAIIRYKEIRGIDKSR
ncbi:MAG: hypothetical protein RLP44_12965 [Aggregatilineales bacterium]